MKIVFISDTHNYEAKVPECDIVIHSGDFTMQGYRWEFLNFLKWYSRVPARYKLFISGNHDFICQDEPEFVKQQARIHDVVYMEHETVEIEGLQIFGSPWTPWFHDWAWNFPRHDLTVAKKQWDEIPPGTDIVVTHGPPYGIADLVQRPRRGEDPHVGCPDLLARLKIIEPRIHEFGHIHEGYTPVPITVPGLRTQFINASTKDLNYKPTNPPVIVEM